MPWDMPYWAPQSFWLISIYHPQVSGKAALFKKESVQEHMGSTLQPFSRSAPLSHEIETLGRGRGRQYHGSLILGNFHTSLS